MEELYSFKLYCSIKDVFFIIVNLFFINDVMKKTDAENSFSVQVEKLMFCLLAHMSATGV